ncbi:hypothetical protein C482_07711 [Natrialba chahannaoensis JCM 10990]|uniref:DUF7967 domain-containing protein n=1 Tax=Natrialba chahannaoensis JCM 10990 TaxID=1227492 RepID=M0AUM9_9EURY|nr:hypothetical protein [Natrialba chahannaoensis]ELZ01069.1 hypothetical protein C482_07711 [Natrialba chahannaoensis JCM 10990]
MTTDDPDAHDTHYSSSSDELADRTAGESGDGSDGGGGDGNTNESKTRVWLVERTYGDDELNLIILVYATPDGRYYHRRERALTSFTGPERETKASLTVSRNDLGTVDNRETRDQYATEATRVAARHDPDDAV